MQLRNCLANLPPSLVTVLGNANTVSFICKSPVDDLANLLKAAQNVVVEIQYRLSASAAKEPHAESKQQSVYLGWTGMPSQRSSKPSINKNAARGNTSRELESNGVEIDATFGRMIGLAEGQKVSLWLLITDLRLTTGYRLGYYYILTHL